jgi:hypothetical protein
MRLYTPKIVATFLYDFVGKARGSKKALVERSRRRAGPKPSVGSAATRMEAKLVRVHEIRAVDGDVAGAKKARGTKRSSGAHDVGDARVRCRPMGADCSKLPPRRPHAARGPRAPSRS